MTASDEGIPTLKCDRCDRRVPWRDGGYRVWIKHNVDRVKGSVGFFVCNECADSFAIWMGQYDESEATGRGPQAIRTEGTRPPSVESRSEGTAGADSGASEPN